MNDGGEDEIGERFDNVSCLIPRGKHSFFISEESKTVTIKGKLNTITLRRDKFVAVKLDGKYFIVTNVEPSAEITCFKSNGKSSVLNNVCFDIKQIELVSKLVSVLGITCISEAHSAKGMLYISLSFF